MLNWSKQVEELCNKLAPKVGMLRRLKNMLPNELLIKIYQHTVQAHIDYCITVWGYAPSLYIDRVQCLQNRAARIITGNYDRNIRGIDLVKDLGWFNVRQRRDYFTALLVYKSLNGISPDYITDLFTYFGDLGVYNTRLSSQNTLCVPRVNKHVFSQSIQVNGPRIWNSLPPEIRNTDSYLPSNHS